MTGHNPGPPPVNQPAFDDPAPAVQATVLPDTGAIVTPSQAVAVIPPASTPAGNSIGVMAITAGSMILLAGALIVALVSKDNTLITTLCGVIAANATMVANYWVGSSSGSARKSETIERQLLAYQPPK